LVVLVADVMLLLLLDVAAVQRLLPGRLTIIIYWPHASHSFDFVFSPAFCFPCCSSRPQPLQFIQQSRSCG